MKIDWDRLVYQVLIFHGILTDLKTLYQITRIVITIIITTIDIVIVIIIILHTW